MNILHRFVVSLTFLLFSSRHGYASFYEPTYYQCFRTVEQPHEVDGRVPVVAFYVAGRDSSRAYSGRFLRALRSVGIDDRDTSIRLLTEETYRLQEPMPIWALFDDGTVLYTPQFEAMIIDGYPTEYRQVNYTIAEKERIENTVLVFSDEFRRTSDTSGCAHLKHRVRLELMIRDGDEAIYVSFSPPEGMTQGDPSRRDVDPMFLMQRIIEDATERGEKSLAAMIEAIEQGMKNAPGEGEPIGTLSEAIVEVPVEWPPDLVEPSPPD